MKSYRFPYILVGIALVIAILYRSPEGGGEQTSAKVSSMPVPSEWPIVQAVEPPRQVEAAPPSEPTLSISPSTNLQTASFSVTTPPMREVPATNQVEQTQPTVPSGTEEKVYPPDSTPHIPPTPPTAVPPLKISVVHHGNEGLKEIALTFDDGPNNKYTPQILDILKERNLKGTFFVLGEQVKRYPEVLRRIAAEGHEIGNHSYSHPQLNRLSDEKVRQEIGSTQEEVKKVLGYTPRLLRPPYGAYRDADLPIFEEYGLNIVLWSVDTYDWKKKGESIERIVNRESRDGSIILFHDRKAETVRVLPEILDELLGRGLKPVTVSELTGLPAYEHETPVVELQKKTFIVAPATSSMNSEKKE